ncbi:unnamed protein product [Cyclocybe aegerita]|uniref:Uncharacterized protein n=1 Tax=Cyclocybe aegerita TaxID=1973307 RepID=A0A8S0W6D6_CYCAE|nr:unnamed protein product [Cyclocybe aegerita]
MYSAAQASSSSHSNAAFATAVDALPTPQMPLAGSSRGPINNQQNSKNTVSRRLSQEALADADVNIPSGCAKESRRAGREQSLDAITSIPLAQERFPSPAGDSEAAGPSNSTTTLPPHPATRADGDQAVHQFTYVHLAQIMREIEGSYELEARQGEEIKTLSEQLFAAAWQASMSTPQEIRHRCLGRVTDLLGEGVGQLVSFDGRHLRLEGKLPERSPSWDFGNLAPGPVLSRGAEQKRRRKESREEVVAAESLPSTAATIEHSLDDAGRPMKRRRLDTENVFNTQEASWAAQVFEEESELQDDRGDGTDPDSDGTDPDSDGTEPDDDAEDPAPQASTSSASSSSANVANPVATTPPQRPRGLQRASTSYDLSFNESLSALPPAPTTPRPKPKKKDRPQHIPVPYSQAAGTWQEKGVLERCWDGWGYIDGRLYLNAREEANQERMVTDWIDRI